ncbi:MAG: hypothetical protein JO090_10230 [Rhizobacter sp.]|nr:hypothetical protein [Rhizobacter sp.]
MLGRLPRCVGVVAAFVAAGGLVAVADRARAQAPVGRACEAPEHRQFDFWVGRWDVYGPRGRKVGENRIDVIADGCALLEQWTGSGGVTGKSLNIYDSNDRRWHQTWVDSTGTLLVLTGALVERSMVMSADPTTSVQQRITWTPAADGSVRQLWESSADGGRTWTVVFDGRYVRAP